jgi:hypothetical protein
MPESGSQSRILPDWIESFLKYTDRKGSPLIFRKWAAIAAVGGALERRVLFENDLGTVYPNLYVMLCAPPGVGKSQAIEPVRELWRSVPDNGLRVTGDDMTKAGLLDELEDAPAKFAYLTESRVDEYRSVLIAAGEFSILLSQMDQGFMANLTKLWDGSPEFRERKRSKGKSETIVGPIVTLLAGAQPGTLVATLPPTAWDQGFMARFILVYSEATAVVRRIASKTAFDSVSERSHIDLKTGLTADMGHLSRMVGIMEFTPDAEDLIEKYNESAIAPVPTHSKLQHYTRRRREVLLKLCLISSASYGNSLRMTVRDVERAVGWMHEAELTMPDVFAAMVGKSDSDLLDELHMFVYGVHTKLQKPVPRRVIWAFLATKVPSDRITHILNTAVKAGLLRSEDMDGSEGSAFTPMPKTASYLH